MKAKIHKEMAFQVISDFPKSSLKQFLLNGISKPEWESNETEKIKWLKIWMDRPDDTIHGSKLRNDHSYKIQKVKNDFKIVFAKSGGEQATVIARLKYSVRDLIEWMQEEEYRVCALELAKSIHWVIDFSSPSHTSYGWEKNQNNGKDCHGSSESHFDSAWSKFYDRTKINFKGKSKITDVYRWAMKFARDNYERNMQLLKVYQNNSSILKPDGEKLGRDVINEIAQNLADYFVFLDGKIHFDDLVSKLK